MADEVVPEADQTPASPAEVDQDAQEAIAIEGRAEDAAQEAAGKKTKHKHKHKHKSHKSKDKKKGKDKDKDAAAGGPSAADGDHEAAAGPQTAPDATANAGEGTAASAAPEANGNVEPASAAASEPESGEIEGEVGGDAAVGSAPAENGLKPEKGSDHKRDRKEKRHRHRSPSSRQEHERKDSSSKAADPAAADVAADAAAAVPDSDAAAADDKADQRRSGKDSSKRHDGDAQKERSDRGRSERGRDERQRSDRDRSARDRPERERSERRRSEADHKPRARSREPSRRRSRSRSRERRRDGSRERPRGASAPRRRSPSSSRRRSRSRDRGGLSAIDRLRREAPRRSADRGGDRRDGDRRETERGHADLGSRDRRDAGGREPDRRSEREIAAERGVPLARGRERSSERGRDRDRRARSRSRDRQDRDRRDGKRGREPEPEPPAVDPEEQARLLAALEGKTEDEEDRLIEQRRRRRQELLAKHAEAAAVSAPTATALAASQATLQQEEQQEQPEPQDGVVAPEVATAAGDAAQAAESPAEVDPAPQPMSVEAAAEPAPELVSTAASEAAAAPEATRAAAPAVAAATPAAAPAAVSAPEAAPVSEIAALRAAALRAAGLQTGMASPRSGAASPAAGDASGPDAARDAQRDGSASPSLSTSSHDAGGGGDPMDIWQPATADDASSGPASAAGAPANVADSSPIPAVVGTRLHALDGRGSTAGADISEAEFASEAQKAQEQTQDGRAAGAEFDMFAEEAEPAAAPAQRTSGAAALADSYDDAEGYYNLQVGEVVNDRYEVFATHGRGVFSSVLRARDRHRKAPDGSVAEVAIKIIRANETMHKAGQTERVILRKLAATDPDGRRHIIRLLSHFEFRGHLCLVFEPMAMNLRELTRKVARNVGINLPAVQLFGKQMLAALYHMHDCGVLHADIKPDNILVNARHNAVKVCDFGSAMFAGDNSVTPYLVSRFYRPPEVILGLPYDYAMDMWSVGCVLYELFTGKILFPGRTNNEMLKQMMDTKGPFPKKMLRKGAFTAKHFDSDPAMSFMLYEEDPVSRKIVCRMISNPKVTSDITRRMAACYGDRKQKEALADLLERMLALDPDKRIKPKDALKHPFLKWGTAPKPPKPPGAKGRAAAAAARP